MKSFSVFLLFLFMLTAPVSALNGQSIPTASEMLDYFSGKKMSASFVEKDRANNVDWQYNIVINHCNTGVYTITGTKRSDMGQHQVNESGKWETLGEYYEGGSNIQSCIHYDPTTSGAHDQYYIVRRVNGTLTMLGRNMQYLGAANCN